MAELKVISNPAYRNYSTLQRHNWRSHEIREDEGSYERDPEELLEGMKILLNHPLWPQFQDGSYLNAEESARLYRLAHGMQGLIHILNRSTHMRGIARDRTDAQEYPLNEFAESQLWCGLIELSKQLAMLSDKSFD